MALTPVKTVQTALAAWQDVASAAQAISSAFNCATTWAASFGVRIARRTGTAFTAGSPNVRIEASIAASGNNSWIPLLTLQPAVGATIGNTTLNGAVTAGATTFVVAASTNFAAGDIVFLGDAATANYELVRIKSISTVTFTPEEAVVNAHANAAIVTSQAFMAFPAIDLSPYVRVRAVLDNVGSGQNTSMEVQITTFDSF